MINEDLAVGESVAAALRLALGLAATHPVPRNWRTVLTVAAAERLAALAWLRSGDFIRQNAPHEVVTAWREGILKAHERACAQRNLTVHLTRALAAEGVTATVLKGIPLASTLYGDIAARASCDIDLFIDTRDRIVASGILSRLGWIRWSGQAPWHESYCLAEGNRSVYLELHSRLVTEALGCRNALAVTHQLWKHDDAEVRVLAGALLPVYLAANLAKHSPVSLLSFLDLESLWARLDREQRRAAEAVAREARVERTLRWGLARAHALFPAAHGDATALRLLGVTPEGRVAGHAYFRLMCLADTPTDGLRVLGNWIWPRSIRPSLSALVRFWSRRMSRSFIGRFIYRRSYAA